MQKTKNSNVLLIVTGSIAAYKAAEILRELKKLGRSVRVIFTTGALHFISPLTFKALGADTVYTDNDQFDVDENGVSLHLSLSRWANAILVAPATADFIAKISSGHADGLAYSVVLAYNFGPNLYFAPAMNSKMWENPITQKNVEFLKKRGVHFIGPEKGTLADNSIAVGRLADIDKIAQTVAFNMQKVGAFSKKRITITCGATREYIDPVRFITNGSSGIMGINLAKYAKLNGAFVTLIAGNIKEKLPYVDEIIRVDTTEDMLNATNKAFNRTDILIMAAAPVDFKPQTVNKSKIKKVKDLVLKLTSTPDILKTVSHNKDDKIIVGFALQTEQLEQNALWKMKEKNMDIVVANSHKNIGSLRGSVILIDKTGRKQEIVNKDKGELANCILKFLKEYINRR